MKIIKESKYKDRDKVLEYLRDFATFKAPLVETPHFNPIGHKRRHYNDHVLSRGERFDPNNPKFNSSMTIDAYERAAQELADTPAEPIDMINTTGTDVVGWVLHQEGNRTNRVIKIRLDSKFKPGYFDVVMYVDNPNDNQIFTFMLGKPRNLENWINEYQYDLYSQGGPDPLYENY